MERMQAHDAPTAPPGWYDDPGGSAHLRYWDGSGWTERLASPSTTDVDEAAPGGNDGPLTTDHPNGDAPVDSAPQTAAPDTAAPDIAAPTPPATDAERLADVLQTAAGLSLTQLSREAELPRSQAIAAIDELTRTGQVTVSDDKPPRYSLSPQARDTRRASLPAPGPAAEGVAAALLSSPDGLSLTQLSREAALSRSEAMAAIDELTRTGQVIASDERPPRYYHVDGAMPPPVATSAVTDRRSGAPGAGLGAGSALAGSSPAAPTAPVTFGAAVSYGMDRMLDFTGRATRPEYWWFALFVLMAGTAALIIAAIPGIGPIITGLVWLVLGLAQLAVGVRRLHDTGRSGAWVFWLSIAPALLQVLALPALGAEAFGLSLALGTIGMILGGIGSLVLLVFLASPGDPQHNRFGPPRA